MNTRFHNSFTMLITIFSFALVVPIKAYSVSALTIISAAQPTENSLTCNAKLGIRSVAFSPDSRLVLASWGMGEARLWWTDTGEIVKTFHMNPANDVTDVGFSPDGNTIATADASETILWDAQTGDQLYILARDFQNDLSTRLTFSNNGKYVLTSGYDGATLWDVQSGKKVISFEGEQDADLRQHALLSPDNQYVMTTNRNQVLLWKLSTGEKLYAFDGAIMGMFTPDSKAILTWGQNEASGIILWGLQTFQKLHNFGEYFRPYWKFSPNGKYLIAVVDMRPVELMLWNTTTYKMLYQFPLTDLYNVYGFLSNSDYLLVPYNTSSNGSISNGIHILDVASGKMVKEILLDTDSPSVFQISSEDKYLMFGTPGGEVKVWNIKTGEETTKYC